MEANRINGTPRKKIEIFMYPPDLCFQKVLAQRLEEKKKFLNNVEVCVNTFKLKLLETYYPQSNCLYFLTLNWK